VQPAAAQREARPPELGPHRSPPQFNCRKCRNGCTLHRGGLRSRSGLLPAVCHPQPILLALAFKSDGTLEVMALWARQPSGLGSRRQSTHPETDRVQEPGGAARAVKHAVRGPDKNLAVGTYVNADGPHVNVFVVHMNVGGQPEADGAHRTGLEGVRLNPRAVAGQMELVLGLDVSGLVGHHPKTVATAGCHRRGLRRVGWETGCRPFVEAQGCADSVSTGEGSTPPNGNGHWAGMREGAAYPRRSTLGPRRCAKT
jgi:hypothetical protein